MKKREERKEKLEKREMRKEKVGNREVIYRERRREVIRGEEEGEIGR